MANTNIKLNPILVNRLIARVVPDIKRMVHDNSSAFGTLIEREQEIMNIEQQLNEMKYQNQHSMRNALVEMIGTNGRI